MIIIFLSENSCELAECQSVVCRLSPFEEIMAVNSNMKGTALKAKVTASKKKAGTVDDKKLELHTKRDNGIPPTYGRDQINWFQRVGSSSQTTCRSILPLDGISTLLEERNMPVATESTIHQVICTVQRKFNRLKFAQENSDSKTDVICYTDSE